MAARWVAVTAVEVRPGDRIRTGDGMELTASRIERPFLGRQEMIAFIEDLPERWIKRPVPADATVERLVTD